MLKWNLKLLKWILKLQQLNLETVEVDPETIEVDAETIEVDPETFEVDPETVCTDLRELESLRHVFSSNSELFSVCLKFGFIFLQERTREKTVFFILLGFDTLSWTWIVK